MNKYSRCVNNKGGTWGEAELLQGGRLAFWEGAIRELAPKLKFLITKFNIRLNGFVKFRHVVRSQEFYDYRSLAGLGPDPQRDDLIGLEGRFILRHVSKCFDGLVRVQLGQVHLPCLLKSFFEFFSYRHDFAFINNIFGKLVQELFLAQALHVIFGEILQEAEFGVLGIL